LWERARMHRHADQTRRFASKRLTRSDRPAK
jgi:hypothetical protein